jgi:predicted transcriptional regulator
MVRTTVTLPEELLKRLKRIAKERDVPLAVVIREALEEKARQERPESQAYPLPKTLGIADSGYADTSELASDPWIYKPRSWR